MSRQFYIVSLKWTRRQDLYISFWRPSDCGYSYPLSWSGKYAEKDVLDMLSYYNSGHSTVAVPCELIDNMAIDPKPGWIDNDAGPVVENTRENWTRILAAVICEPKVKPNPEWQGKRGRAKEVA